MARNTRNAATAITVDPMTAMQAQIDALTALVTKALEAKAPKVESAPKVEPITWNIDEMSHAEVRQLAITHKVAVTLRGKVAQTTRDALKAKLGQVAPAVAPKVQAPKVRSTAKVAVVTDTLDLFSSAPMSAEERDGVRISRTDAAEALATHPMREVVLQVTREGWAKIRRMGAPVEVLTIDGKRMPKPGTTFHPNPAGLSGADRKQAHYMWCKPGSKINDPDPERRPKATTLYKACLILDKLTAAGVLK